MFTRCYITVPKHVTATLHGIGTKSQRGAYFITPHLHNSPSLELYEYCIAPHRWFSKYRIKNEIILTSLRGILSMHCHVEI